MITRTLATIAICGALGIALGVGLAAYALDCAARAVRGPGRTGAREDVPRSDAALRGEAERDWRRTSWSVEAIDA